MNEKTSNAASGALTGAVLAATAAWSRYDDDTQRRLSNVRDDARDAANQIRDLQSRGEAIRARLAVVQDFQVGVAVANATEPSSAVLPTVTPILRPNIFDSMEASIADLNFPPQPGQYDARGMVLKVGEMTALGLALTFQETRAFLQGLLQDRPPSRDGNVQIFYAANALIKVVKDLRLTANDYIGAWQRLFGAGSGSGGATAVSHTNVQTAPTVLAVDPGVASMKPLGLPDIPLPYKHQNTDAANKWRITVGAANINAGAVVSSIQFGQTYTKNGEAYQPVVSVNDPRFQVVNVTATGFQIMNLNQLIATQAYDIYIGVTGGCC